MRHHLMLATLGAASLGLAGLAATPDDPAAPGSASKDDQDVRVRTMILKSDPLDLAKVRDGGLDAMNVEVIRNNDDLTVIVNGEEIPADRIEEKDGQVIVYGKDGEILTNVRLFTGKGGGTFAFDLEGFPGINLRGDLDNVILGEVFGDLEIDFAEIAEPPSVMMGVVLSPVDPALAYHLGLDAGAATVLTEVYDGFPAANAGLKKYDIIVEVDGRRPAAPSDVRSVLRERNPGDLLKLGVIQGGVRNELHVGLDARDAKRLYEAGAKARGANVFFGPAGDGAPAEFEWTPLRTPGEQRIRLFMPDQAEVDALLERFPGQNEFHFGDAGSRRDAIRARIAELEAKLEALTEEMNQKP